MHNDKNTSRAFRKKYYHTFCCPRLLPYSLKLIALNRIAPDVCGILLSFELVAAGITGLVVLGEHLGRATIAGMTSWILG